MNRFSVCGRMTLRPVLFGRKSSNGRNVHAAFVQAFEAHFAERIIADSGMEADTVPETRKVMGKNRRRAAERKGQI